MDDPVSLLGGLVSLPKKGALAKLRRVIANRPGPIVQIVVEKISPESYCYERVVCVDLTATGGNVSLLTTLES